MPEENVFYWPLQRLKKHISEALEKLIKFIWILNFVDLETVGTAFKN